MLRTKWYTKTEEADTVSVNVLLCHNFLIVRVCTRVPFVWYHGTRVPWYKWYHGTRTMVPLVRTIIVNHGTRVLPWNRHTRVPLVLEYQFLVRTMVHACEDCGGDPRCRHRCRVGTSTVVYRDAFYADNAHLCPCCT